MTGNTNRAFLIVPLVLLTILLGGCSGGGSKFPEVLVIKDGDVVPILASSELVVGDNRFVLGFLDPQGVPISDANVKLTFYDLNGGKETKKAEMTAVARVPARDAGIMEQIDHIHPDGTKHTHFNAGEEIGVYTTQVTFDNAGDWGVEIVIDAPAQKIKKTLRPRFNVLPQGTTPPVGVQAPKSRNLTAKDVTDLSVIDSSANPSAELHTSTVADAIAAGKPTLVLFAVPGFCDSRLCGPELEIMKKLYPKYRDKAEFIHIEFYTDPGSPNRTPVEAVREWGLRTEPWFFLIDSKGTIAAKFEGPTSLQELDEALSKIAR